MVSSCVLVTEGEHIIQYWKKLGVKNLAVCENQGKQHKSRVMEKKTGGDDAKKTKRLTETEVLTNDFT